MTSQEAKALLANPKFQAFANGEAMQWNCLRNSDAWEPTTDLTTADFLHADARIRIKPKPLERWVNVYADGAEVFHQSKNEADKLATEDRLRCVHLREVEEIMSKSLARCSRSTSRITIR